MFDVCRDQLRVFFSSSLFIPPTTLSITLLTMARVASHTPSWLSAPSPGFNLFQRATDSKPAAAYRNGNDKDASHGPSRTIAHRGTEVFVLVGNDIRWSDLVMLKDAPKNTQDQNYRASPFVPD